MNRFSRYIFRQLLTGIILVSAGLVAIIWLTQSIRFIESIINQGSSAGTFILITILLLPNFLTIVLPIALFTVILFVYSKLNADRELIILRAAGVGHMRLAAPALILALLVTFVSYSLSLYLTPRSYQQFRELQWDVRHSLANIVLKEGTFNTVSNKLTVYFRERSTDNELRGIFVHETRPDDEPVIYIAERGALVESETGPRVLMFDGVVQQVDKIDPGRTRTTSFDQYPLDISFAGIKPANRYREARERGTRELLTLRPESVGNPRDYGKFVVEGHQRITGPLTGLVFSLVALFSLLSGDFARQGQARRITVAVCIVVALQVANLGLGNVIAKNVALVPLLYASVALPLIVGFLALWFMPYLRLPGRPVTATS